MSTLAEIEEAVEQLPSREQQELLRFLAGRLHAQPGEQGGGGAPQAEFPIVRCAPGVRIEPTKEQLGDF